MSFGIKLRDEWCSYYNCWITFDYLDDSKPLFKVRDSNRDRDFCVYFVYDGTGRIVYIGKGRYWHYTKYGYTLWLKSRPFKHNDFLRQQIKSNFKVAIIYDGLTNIEAKLLEALYIYKAINSGRTLTKQNAKKWDGMSLINKRREMLSTFYEVASVYLNEWVWKSLKTSY